MPSNRARGHPFMGGRLPAARTFSRSLRVSFFFFQFYNMQIPLHRWNLTRTISVDRHRRRHSPMGGVRGGKQNQRRRRRIFVIPKSEGQASKHTKKSILNTFTAVAGALFTILTDWLPQSSWRVPIFQPAAVQSSIVTYDKRTNTLRVSVGMGRAGAIRAVKLMTLFGRYFMHVYKYRFFSKGFTEIRRYLLSVNAYV